MPSTGAYRIWTADKDGNLIDPPSSEDYYTSPPTAKTPRLNNPEAVDIYFGLIEDEYTPQSPSTEQIELIGEIEKVLTTARRLYLDNPQPLESKFRRYYIRLFRLSQLGLEGDNASPEHARAALLAVTNDLIDDEAGKIKNGHLNRLGGVAIWFSIPFLLGYVLLTCLDPATTNSTLGKLHIVRPVAEAFMLLWIGCFLGVWLSYGIRTATFTLTDLTSTDSDRLLPPLRLAFAGALTMILGTLFVLGIVEIKIGSYAVTDLKKEPSLAFLIGVFCGLSEKVLPNSVTQRADAFISSLK